MSKTFDFVVIGSGPGGYVAAIRASQLGLKTAVVEKEHLGGVCLNWGCIPTKALLRTAEVYRNIQHASAYGLKVGKAEPDLEAIVKRSRDIAGQLSGGVKHLLKKNKITVIDGFGKLGKDKGKPAVHVELSKGGSDTLNAKHIMLATGARARTIPQAGLEPDGKLIWTAKEAMVPDVMPKRLLVIGSGAIGIEFASFYSTMGSEVTVVEMADRILPAEDEEVSAFALKSFKKDGIKFHLGATLEGVKTAKATLKAKIKTADGTVSEESFDRAVLAIGIVGNVEGIGLEEFGIKTDRGHVLVDGYGRTNVEGVYAIGDLTGPPWLAHKASHEAIVCVEHFSGHAKGHPFDPSGVPGCTYCIPQVASIGMTEAQAKKAGKDIRVGKFPFMGNGKAIALGEPEGFVKTVFDTKTGELLGAHMIGAEVTELIQGYAVAMQGELTEAELMETIFPHPTLSEMMHESVLDAYDRVIHF